MPRHRRTYDIGAIWVLIARSPGNRNSLGAVVGFLSCTPFLSSSDFDTTSKLKLTGGE